MEFRRINNNFVMFENKIIPHTADDPLSTTMKRINECTEHNRFNTAEISHTQFLEHVVECYGTSVFNLFYVEHYWRYLIMLFSEKELKPDAHSLSILPRYLEMLHELNLYNMFVSSFSERNKRRFEKFIKKHLCTLEK